MLTDNYTGTGCCPASLNVECDQSTGHCVPSSGSDSSSSAGEIVYFFSSSRNSYVALWHSVHCKVNRCQCCNNFEKRLPHGLSRTDLFNPPCIFYSEQR